MKFEYYGDSLVRRIAGPRADWLRICNDTIWGLGTDTRRDNIRFLRGLPYLMPCRDAAVTDSGHHCLFMTHDRDNLITSRYSSGKGCSFILPGSDTIMSTYCIDTELCDTLSKVSHRRWYAEGAVWPVVEYVDIKIGEDEFTSLNICPPEDQPRSRMYAKGKTSRTPSDIYGMLAMIHSNDPLPSSPLPPHDSLPYTINLADGRITVGGEDIDNVTLRLYDTAGRQWHEGAASSAIPTSHLPAGIYLLHITSYSTSCTVKLSFTGS